MLKKIEIKGYRSIHDAAIELRNLNVLIGANGAGKSNFVSFFKLLNEMIADRLQEYIGKTGRSHALLHFGPKVTSEIRLRLEFDVPSELPSERQSNAYVMRLALTAGDTLQFVEETLSQQEFLIKNATGLGSGHQETNLYEAAARGQPTAKVLHDLLMQCRVYHFHDTSLTARFRQATYIHDNRTLLPDAGNLASILFAYKQRNTVVYRRIVSTIRKIMPEFDDFELEPSRLNPNDIFLNWRKKGWDYLFGPHQISDGSLRAMAIVTLFLQPETDLPLVHPGRIGLPSELDFSHPLGS